MTELPNFELLKRQPHAPHVARTVATNNVPNEYGTVITYRVRESRRGGEWWIDASLNGMRMSNTLHTKIKTKAETWIRDVRAGRVAVSRETKGTGS